MSGPIPGTLVEDFERQAVVTIEPAYTDPSTGAVYIQTEKWEVRVRVRASVGQDAHLSLRFSLVNAARVLETVWAERVQTAKGLLGENRTLLRAAS